MKSKKLILVVLLVVCGLFLGTAFEVMANPWSMYHADAGHTNHSPHTGPTMPGLLWQGPSGPMGPLHTNTGTAVGADGTIYVGGWDGNLYALNPDGTIKGIFDGSAAGLTNAGICCGAPIIGPDGTIYVSGRYTWALNPDLTIKWQQTYYSGLCCGSLTVGPDGTLYRGEWGLPLMAYDAATGAVKWTFSEGPGEWFTHSPALNSDGSTAYVTTQHTIYAVNTADGSMEWSYPIDNPGFGAPAVAADDKIYVASGQTIVVFSKRGPDNKGNPNRVIQVGSNVFEIALDPDGSIACVTFDTVTEIPGTGSDAGIAEDARDGSVHMINADGSIRWSAPFLGNAQPNYMTQFAPVIDAAGTVYLLTRTYDWRIGGDSSPAFLYGFSSAGTLLFLEALPPATGTYAYEGPTQVTIAADGTLYASWFGGRLYAFRQADPWAMYHGDHRHTNESPYAGPTSPTAKWTGPDGGAGPLHTNTGTAVGADGTIYVGGWDGNLYALNPDGTIKGIFDGSAAGLTNAGICCGAPIIGPDGTIYVSGRYTWALNPDLTIKWQQTYYSGLCCGSLTVGPDGTLYRGEWGLPLMAYDAATGAVKWMFSELRSDEDISHSPAVSADGMTAYVTTQHTLYAVNTADGTMAWSYPIQNPGWMAPVLDIDGLVYIASGTNLDVLNPDGTLSRQIAVGSNVFEAALAGDGSIVCVTFDTVTLITGTYDDAGVAEDARDGTLVALNADGTVRWSAPILGNAQPNYMTQFAPVLDAKGNVYILTREYDWRDRSNDVSPAFLYGFSSAGTLLFLEALPPATGTYAYEGPTQVTIAADGTLYASWFGGYVYAFGSVEISATCASGSVTISGAGFGANEPGTGVSYTETVCTGKGKNRTCTDETTDCPVISWYDAEIVADCGICPATVDVVTVTDSFSVDVTSDGGGGDPPANCGDYTDEGSCTTAGCNWNANKGMCK